MQYFVNQLRRLMLANGAVKRTTLALLDVLIAAGSAVLSFWLRLGTWEIAIAPVAIFFAMAIVAWFVAAKIFGIYSQIIRYAGIRTVARSEEHTSELQSLMRISYAVFCLKKKKNQIT